MSTYPLLYTDNTTKWGRTLLLFNLYWPVLKPNLIIFAIYPFVACFLAAAIKTGTESFAIDTLLNFAITFNVCVCPILLVKHDYRDICAQLPVTASEKLRFLLTTFWLLFPGIIYGSFYLGQVAGNALFHIYIPIEFFCLPTWEENFGKAPYYLWNFLLIFSTISVVLYYTVKTRKNRTLAGIVSFIVMNVLVLILIVLSLVVYGKYLNLRAYQLNTEAFIFCLNVTLGVIGIIGLVYLVKLYRLLRHSGF